MDSPQEGRRIRCHACRVELEVIDSDPFDLDFADWRDRRSFEDGRREDESESSSADEQASSERYESTALHRAAYGDHDLTEP